jgi:hypothetical protein
LSPAIASITCADDLVRPGQRNRADDDPRRPGGDADPDHVAGTGISPSTKVAPAGAGGGDIVAMRPGMRLHRAMRQRHDDHEMVAQKADSAGDSRSRYSVRTIRFQTSTKIGSAK